MANRLASAVMDNDAELVGELLAAGAGDPNGRISGIPLLGYAAGHGYWDVVGRLLPSANVHAMDGNGLTALMSAAASGRDAILEEILGAGGNPYDTDGDGRTALMHACAAGDMNCVTALLYKSDANHQDGEGLSPIMVAAMCGHSGITGIMTRHSNLELRDQDGKTALLWGAEGGLSVVLSLLAAGADPLVTDNDGAGLLDYAADNLTGDEMSAIEASLAEIERDVLDAAVSRGAGRGIKPSV